MFGGVAQVSIMAEEQIPVEDHRSRPRRLHDRRLALRFFACFVVFTAGCGAAFLASSSGWVPERFRLPVFFGGALVGIGSTLFLFAPALLGIRCQGCGRRIFKAPGRPRGALRFYCPACHVEWETGLRETADGGD
jgi:hypothetical protein